MLLLEAGRQEAKNIAILTAITCSSLNYYADTAPPTLLKELKRFLPPEPVILLVLARRHESWFAEGKTTLLVERLSTHVSGAKRQLRAASGAPKGMDRQDVMHLCRLWRVVADSALLALYEIDRISEDAANSEWHTTLHMLDDMLIAARDGGAPCVVEGRPVMPSWAERRNHARMLVNMDAAVRSHGKSRAVRVVDISRGGLGLDRADGLQVDEIIMITLAIGRRLVGKVAWVKGTRAGITLSSELATDDPLISSG